MENILNKNEVTRAVLVGVMLKTDDEQDFEASLQELARLADTAGADVVAVLTQNKENPDARSYLGSGKLKELKELCENNEITMVIFDGELMPSQIKNVEDDLGGDITVIDRSMLILDIFALHAKSGEGKLQVELAQLKYTVPRLTGHGKDLSRLGGGIGTRGPGESKLETDRRHVNRRIDALKEQIKELEKNRAVQRAARDRSGIFRAAIVGYTNAGKSTRLNAMTDAGVLSEDKLFATLDTTTRKYSLPSGEEMLLTDTVGFIRNLPHHLVEAFKSTLDEIKYSDALLVVVDGSDSEYPKQIEVTQKLIEELGAGALPVLYIYNKSDLGTAFSPGTPETENVYISALTRAGIDVLVDKLDKLAHMKKKQYTFLLPNDKLGLVNSLYSNATVLSCEYSENGAAVIAVADEKTAGPLKKYILSEG
ncbi:MAG: GTPase HflX [Clostridia bacterium]|nr:GTPase HflX [Clostridia bacterium]